MPWLNPLPLSLVATDDTNSFQHLPAGVTGLPVGGHPGAFAVRRLHHTHEGVDLYCDEGTPVLAVESGRVVAVIPFTGEHAGSPWWHNTWAVFVEGASGVVVYGEIRSWVEEGEQVCAGQCLGEVVQVLKKDKGRPMSMLHLELHEHGTRQSLGWPHSETRPRSLQDPTPYLLPLAQQTS